MDNLNRLDPFSVNNSIKIIISIILRHITQILSVSLSMYAEILTILLLHVRISWLALNFSFWMECINFHLRPLDVQANACIWSITQIVITNLKRSIQVTHFYPSLVQYGNCSICFVNITSRALYYPSFKTRIMDWVLWYFI